MKSHQMFWATLLTAAMAAGSCSEKSSPSDPPAQSPTDGTIVRGTERVTWSQRASSLSDVREFFYTIYIDGTGTRLAEARCIETGTPQSFECSTPIPRMTPGRHSLEVSATHPSSNSEGPRSTPPLIVTWQTLEAPGAALESAATSRIPSEVCASGTEADCYSVAALIEQISAPRDIIALPDNRLMLVSSNRIDIYDGGSFEEAFRSGPEESIASVAIDSAFARTHLVFVALQRGDRDSGQVRVVRAREVGDRLGEAATIVPDIQASPEGTTVIAVGPDRRIYLAMPGGMEPSSQPGPYDRTVLRFEDDGTAAVDVRMHGPIFSSGSARPEVLAVGPDGRLWLGATDPAIAAVSVVSDRGRLLSITTASRPALNAGVRDLAASPAAPHGRIFVIGNTPRVLYAGVTRAGELTIGALNPIVLPGLEPVAVALRPSGDLLVAARRGSAFGDTDATVLSLRTVSR